MGSPAHPSAIPPNKMKLNRRRFLAGVGGISVGTTAVVGSGAFSSTDADRGITISVENDDRAYLRLFELDEDFAYSTGNLLEFRFDEDFRSQTNTEDQGDGPGSDSVYEFTRVFGVGNKGTKPVQVFGLYEDDALNDVKLLEYAPNPSDDPLTKNARSSWINPGNSLQVSIVLDTENVPVNDYSTTIEIVAAADDSHVFP